jgi:hypothetical protein
MSTPQNVATVLFSRRVRNAVPCVHSCIGANRKTTTIPCANMAGSIHHVPQLHAIRPVVAAPAARCPAM